MHWRSMPNLIALRQVKNADFHSAWDDLGTAQDAAAGLTGLASHWVPLPTFEIRSSELPKFAGGPLLHQTWMNDFGLKFFDAY